MIWLTSTWSPGLTCQATMSASVRPSPTSGSLNSLSSVITAPSVAERPVDGVQDAVQVRQVVILEPRWRVRSGEAAHPEHRRLQLIEALLGHAGGDLRPEPGVDRGLVRHDAAAGLAHRGADRIDVDRG